MLADPHYQPMALPLRWRHTLVVWAIDQFVRQRFPVFARVFLSNGFPLKLLGLERLQATVHRKLSGL
jgi:hypothetical protein